MADKQPMSREAYRRQKITDKARLNKNNKQHQAVKASDITEKKIKHLKRKLNWAILIVFVLIIIVYVILFKA